MLFNLQHCLVVATRYEKQKKSVDLLVKRKYMHP